MYFTKATTTRKATMLSKAKSLLLNFIGSKVTKPAVRSRVLPVRRLLSTTPNQRFREPCLSEARLRSMKVSGAKKRRSEKSGVSPMDWTPTPRGYCVYTFPTMPYSPFGPVPQPPTWTQLQSTFASYRPPYIPPPGFVPPIWYPQLPRRVSVFSAAQPAPPPPPPPSSQRLPSPPPSPMTFAAAAAAPSGVSTAKSGNYGITAKRVSARHFNIVRR